VVRLVAGGKEFKTNKSKKDGGIGENFTFEGSADSLQVGTSSLSTGRER
jgi:hypothetical protein